MTLLMSRAATDNGAAIRNQLYAGLKEHRCNFSFVWFEAECQIITGNTLFACILPLNALEIAGIDIVGFSYLLS
jgi:hypothetical protein